jgi:dolichol-phosphate mannosyltransferase
MHLAAFLLALNLFKLYAARSFPLIGDEAYYWLWSKHLDLSYVDHPPMIAYFNTLLSFLFGDNEMAVRLGAILIVLLVSWIIYLTAKELYDKKAATAAVIIFNLMPTFFGGGMFLVPQTVLFLFYSLSFYFLVRLRKTGRPVYWYLLGISTGAGLLSDYVMGLFVIGTFLLLLLDKDLTWQLRSLSSFFCRS